jgi:acetyl-CoA acetyltransferase
MGRPSDGLDPICDAVRTPIGRYGGALSGVRADDLAAIPIKALMAERNPGVDWGALDDVVLGCANQAGEDNRNVARMAPCWPACRPPPRARPSTGCAARAWTPWAYAARAIKSGEAQLMIAGGVESMSRAPFVMGKADSAFSRNAEIFDTTIGWRFVNPAMRKAYGVDSMPETAENVADDHGGVTRRPGRLRPAQPNPRGGGPGLGPASTPRSFRSPCPSARAIRSSCPATSTRAPPRSRRCRPS